MDRRTMTGFSMRNMSVVNWKAALIFEKKMAERPAFNRHSGPRKNLSYIHRRMWQETSSHKHRSWRNWDLCIEFDPKISRPIAIVKGLPCYSDTVKSVISEDSTYVDLVLEPHTWIWWYQGCSDHHLRTIEIQIAHIGAQFQKIMPRAWHTFHRKFHPGGQI